jgi:hypothetical protein
VTAVAEQATQITEPGVYDIPAEAYHADPVPQGSLSSSGARRLLPPSCPAKFQYERQHGRPPKREFEFGHAAHRIALGVGHELALIDAADYRTKAAKEDRDAAREAGRIPLLAHEHDVVQDMASALLQHPLAPLLFQPGTGHAEQSLFARDEATGVMLRARLDWLPAMAADTGRLIIPDYKSCVSASPEKVERSIADYGYHLQGAWYEDLVRALGLARDVAFVLVFQEKTAPYLVHVVQPDALAMRIARHRNREAIDLYAECAKANRWPGYSDDVTRIPLPAWEERKYEELI